MSSFVVVEQERQARNKTVIQSVIGCSGRLFIFQGQRVTSKAQTGCLERVQKEGSKLSRLIGPIRTKVKNVLLYPSIQEAGKREETYDKK